MRVRVKTVYYRQGACLLYYISQCLSFVCVSVCLCVCVLPFFSATRGSFISKFGMVLENTVGRQAKHFGANRVNTFRVICHLVTKNVKF